jgi:hypothetical protein
MSIAEKIERKLKDSKDTQTINNVGRTPAIIPKETWSRGSNEISTRDQSREKHNTRGRSNSTRYSGEQRHYHSQRYKHYSRERSRDRYQPRRRSRSTSEYREIRRDQTPGTEQCRTCKGYGYRSKECLNNRRRQMVCYNCQKTGHIARNCRTRYLN